MISAVAKGNIANWKADADSDLEAQALSQNAMAYAERIWRYVALSKRVDELIDQALLISAQISYQNCDQTTLSRLRKTLRTTLDQLLIACDEAGLSHDARTLGS